MYLNPGHDYTNKATEISNSIVLLDKLPCLHVVFTRSNTDIAVVARATACHSRILRSLSCYSVSVFRFQRHKMYPPLIKTQYCKSLSDLFIYDGHCKMDWVHYKTLSLISLSSWKGPEHVCQALALYWFSVCSAGATLDQRSVDVSFAVDMFTMLPMALLMRLTDKLLTI